MTYLLGRSKEINTYIAWERKKTKGRQQGIVRYTDKPYHGRMLLRGRKPRLISEEWQEIHTWPLSDWEGNHDLMTWISNRIGL